ncbi:hypothetical protein [Streptomyces sp. NPDC054829]
MDERHLLNRLMKAVAEEQSEFVVRPWFGGLKKLAEFALVADRFGYEYVGHAPGNAALNDPCFLFRRLPDARERAGVAVGDSVGPQDRGEVELLYSRMVVDACGRYTPRVLSNVLLFPVVAAVFLFFPGYTAERVLVAGGIWLVLLVLFLAGLGITRRRRALQVARRADARVTR